MSDYISPTLGIIPEETIGLVSDAHRVGFSSFKSRMLVEHGYGVLRSGILYSEYYLDGSRLGSDHYDKLVDFGFSYADALSIIRIFAADNMLQSDLVDLGFEIDSVVYGLDLPGRLKALGLVSRTVTSRYALESTITVYSLREIVPPPLPPPEFEVWKTFQLSLLLKDYKAKAKKARNSEFVGIFTARKYDIIDWESLRTYEETTIPETFLKKAGDAALEILEAYISIKGYDWVPIDELKLGFNEMPDEPEINVLIDEADMFKTKVHLEVVDYDYDRKVHPETVSFTGRWWLDKSYYITQTRNQITSMRRFW